MQGSVDGVFLLQCLGTYACAYTRMGLFVYLQDILNKGQMEKTITAEFFTAWKSLLAAGTTY